MSSAPHGDWLAVFASIADPRGPMGRRHNLPAMRAGLTCGILAQREVRGHWGIENGLHWQLDVTFGEDQCRIRKGHGDGNFSTLRRTALSLLKQEKTAKCGVNNKRLYAGWDNDYMEKEALSGLNAVQSPCPEV